MLAQTEIQHICLGPLFMRSQTHHVALKREFAQAIVAIIQLFPLRQSTPNTSFLQAAWNELRAVLGKDSQLSAIKVFVRAFMIGLEPESGTYREHCSNGFRVFSLPSTFW